MSTPRLQIAGLCKAFGKVEVLRDVDLTCFAGTVVGLVGRNGSGKTTLLSCISGRLGQDAGVILLDGRRLPKEPPWRRAARGIGWTFQDTTVALTATVSEMVNLAAARSGLRTIASYADLDASMSDILGLRWQQLSFGQRKLAALRVALARSPRLLLLDEPAAGLAAPLANLVAATLRTAAREGAAVVLVEHDRGFVTTATDQVAVLDQGRIAVTGTAAIVLETPETMETLT